MSINDDRIELTGSRRERLVAQLKEAGGGRAVCPPNSDEWKIQAAMPPAGWKVIDIHKNGRVEEFTVQHI